MSDDNHPLFTLLQVEQAQRDQARAHLQRVEAQQAQAREKAEHLARHRSETIERWTQRNQPGGQGSCIAMLQTYRSFMQRLDQALAQQELQTERCAGQVDVARQALIAAETKVAAVQKLIDRRAQAERLRERRHEQKRSDEAAQRSGFVSSQMSEFTSMC